MHVAAQYRGTPNQSSLNSAKNVDWSDPQGCQISLRCHKKCLRYPMSKIFAPGKVDHSLSNSLNTCYAPMPLIMSNFIALGRTKALQNFLHPQYFGAPGALYAKVHQFWQASPSTKLSNFVAFGDGLTDKTHTKTVNDMFPHAYHKAIIITSNSSLLF